MKKINRFVFSSLLIAMAAACALISAHAAESGSIYLQAVISRTGTNLVTVNSGANGSVLDANGNPVESFVMPDDTDVTVQIRPKSGYRIANVLFNETDLTAQVKADGTLRLPYTSGSIALTVTYEALPVSSAPQSSASGISSQGGAQPASPPTGDAGRGLPFLLFAFSAAAAALLLTLQRKKAVRS